LAGEKYLQALAIDGGFAVTLLRYANVYGPRQDGRGEAGVIGIWMRRLLDGHEAAINGDGLQTRDFVFVADVVSANLAAFAGGVAGTFNVGTGVETNLVQLYRKTAEACGSALPFVHAAAKPGEQRRSVLDPARTGAALGLTSWVTLETGLRETASWFRRQPKAG
jgi:UDP-glucose 4-epimerase